MWRCWERNDLLACARLTGRARSAPGRAAAPAASGRRDSDAPQRAAQRHRLLEREAGAGLFSTRLDQIL